MAWHDASDTALHATPDLEASIARCRVLLSAIAIVAVYVDPTHPTLTRWVPLRGGAFTIDGHTLLVMAGHLIYSVSVWALLARRRIAPATLARLTPWLDTLFGGLIALVTEGATSPFYAFFAFAVLAVGLRAGLRATLVVTAASTALYLSLLAVSAPDTENFAIMRPAYLAITGYLVGYLGQQRLNLERHVRELEGTSPARSTTATPRRSPGSTCASSPAASCCAGAAPRTPSTSSPTSRAA
jgi:hypothetical protein